MIDFDVAMTIFSEYLDGFLQVAVDMYGEPAYGTEKTTGRPLEAMHPYGLISRPKDPDADPSGNATVGAGALYGFRGERGFVMPMTDPRSVAKLPELQRGEAILHGDAAQFARMHADGSISLYTTDDGTPTGRALYFKITPTKGFEMSCPWGRFTMGPLGIHLLHSSGARLDLGAIGGLPGPLGALSSYAKLEGGVTSVKGGAVSVGTDGGAVNEAATAALFLYISTLVGALAALTAGPTAPVGAAVAPSAAALVALQASIGQIGKVV